MSGSKVSKIWDKEINGWGWVKNNDNWFEWYQGLMPDVKQQLENQKLIDTYKSHPKYADKFLYISNKLHEIAKDKLGNRDGLKGLIDRLTLFHAIPTQEVLLNKDIYDSVFCYHFHPKRPNVFLTNKIAKHRHSIIMEGFIDNKDSTDESEPKKIPVIVKFFEHGSHDVSAEIKVYEDLRNRKCSTPWFARNYEFWGESVLVMQKLELLDTSCDEYKVGVDVLNQLKCLHTFGVHSDIKPSNIMYDEIKNINYIIDHGGVSRKKYGYGYLRHTWTHGWTSQKVRPVDDQDRPLPQITTAYHDLKELGFTLRGIQIAKEKESRLSNVDNSSNDSDDDLAHGRIRLSMKDGIDNPQKGFTGKLNKYMDRVTKINRTEKITPEVYQELIDILSA